MAATTSGMERAQSMGFAVKMAVTNKWFEPARMSAAVAALALAAVGCTPTTNQDSNNPKVTPTGTASTPAEQSGQQAPEFTLDTMDGNQISLSDYRGKKVVLIDFWSTTCKPCLQEMPELVKIYNERKDKGFEILAIATDPPETVANVRPVAKNHGMIFPVLLDEESEVMDLYNPKGTLPFTLVVNRAGNIVLKRASYTPGDEESAKQLVAAIDTAMAQK